MPDGNEMIERAAPSLALLALTVGLVALCLWLMRPFASALAWAADAGQNGNALPAVVGEALVRSRLDL